MAPPFDSLDWVNDQQVFEERSPTVSTAFEPIIVGSWKLPQRFVMAPLTRNRAKGTVPGELNAEYYGQRAGAGLIITEGSQPSAVGQGYLDTPGFHSPEQLAGWSRVAEAVHAGGGHVVAQLMHVGRVAHPDNKGGLESVAPSALPADGKMVTAEGQVDMPTPRALETDEIPGVVEEFVTAARNAVEAGLDGVEVHAANGYLIHQFLGQSSNTRTDGYGGSPEGHARFAIEVTRAVAEAIGADKVGIRISPAHNIQGVLEEDEAFTTRDLRDARWTASRTSTWPTSASWPTRAARSSPTCAHASAVRSCSTPASVTSPTSRASSRSSRRTSATWSPSVASSSPTPTSPSAGARVPS